MANTQPSEFDFLRNVSIGQYLPAGSWVHHMDPRFKLLAFALLVGLATLLGSLVGQLVLLAATLLLVWQARVPIAYALRTVWLTVPFILIFAVLQLFFAPAAVRATGCQILWSWGPLLLTDCLVQLIARSVLRFATLLLLTSLLTLTTTTNKLAQGTEKLLRPFERVGFPAHAVAMTLTIALRFVPTLALELETLAKAQASRGADFGSGSRWAVLQRTRRILPLIVPLFVNSLDQAETLALAMEARGYMGGQGRGTFRQLQAQPQDWLALAVATAFTVLLWVWLH
ncbi:MAG: energy-coupling factor transporter transmembrane protein EcfT [Chloroflexi bacterium]|nr:energy-coupling factor transporter transmembrane protein EcfT [Chloroflexota bacterium]